MTTGKGYTPMQQKPFLYPMEEKKHFSQVTNLLFPKMHPNSLNRQKEAYESVLKYAGASLKYDDVDKRIIANVRNGDYTTDGSNGSEKGLIDKASDVGGWPEYKKETGPKDTDGDGIPDEWETANGLNPKSKADGSKYTLSKTYTNLEVYLNSLVETLYPNK